MESPAKTFTDVDEFRSESILFCGETVQLSDERATRMGGRTKEQTVERMGEAGRTEM